MEFKIIKLGNSAGILLSKKLLKENNKQIGDVITIEFNNTKNVITNTDNKQNVITSNKSSEFAHNKEYYQEKLEIAIANNDLSMVDYYTNKLKD